MTSEELVENAPRIYHGVAGLEAAVGEELGPTDWIVVDQTRVDGFADATEDHQWIHVDPERAASGPYGGTIAHGFLTLSLVPFLNNRMRTVEPITMGVNYGLEKVRFPAPVKVGARIRGRASIVRAERIGDNAVQTVTRTVVEVEGGDKPACVAESVVRYFFA